MEILVHNLEYIVSCLEQHQGGSYCPVAVIGYT